MGPKLSPTLKRPPSPLTAPNALLAYKHTHPMKYVTQKMTTRNVSLVIDHISEDSEWLLHGGQPAMWISRLAAPGCAVVTKGRFSRLCLSLFACIYI